jgi:hypothetical protein
MPVYQITPLAPAGLLLLGAVLILTLGPVLGPRRRHLLMVGMSALAVLSLFFVSHGDVLARVPAPQVRAGQADLSSRYPADGESVRVLVEWLDEPALVLRLLPFEPFPWVLMLSLLAISLAGRDTVERTSPLSQAVLLALTAVASGVMLAGNYRSLAFALLIFDGMAALFILAHRQPTGSRAVGRLLLGVLSSATVVALAQGMDQPTAGPVELGGLFSLTIWLRLGLYPLIESEALGDALPPLRLGWTVVNMGVGLYLISTGMAPWVVWLAGATTVLHGALACLGPGRDGLAHVGHTLAGGILTMVAVVGNGPAVVAASMSTLAALVALELTPAQLDRADRAPSEGWAASPRDRVPSEGWAASPWDWSHPRRLWGYLPPLLATVSLVGVPFTLGWEGRGDLYRATWEAGALGAVALAVVAEGAALSVLYRYWQQLLRDTPADQADVWRLLGATLATLPFLIPVVGPRLLSSLRPPAPISGDFTGAVLGLVGSLLWALFLGYGRSRLLDAMPLSPDTLMGVLRLGWLLRGLGRTLDTMGRGLLRIRAVVEGEHYLAWAILLAMGVWLLVVLR